MEGQKRGSWARISGQFAPKNLLLNPTHEGFSDISRLPANDTMHARLQGRISIAGNVLRSFLLQSFISFYSEIKRFLHHSEWLCFTCLKTHSFPSIHFLAGLFFARFISPLCCVHFLGFRLSVSGSGGFELAL